MSNDRQHNFNKRLFWLKILFTLLAVCLSVYMFCIQVIDIKHYKNKAKLQRTSKKFIMRGSILDRNGIKLASDQLSYNVYLHKTYQDHTPEELAEKLAEHLELSKSELISRMNRKGNIVPLKKGISRETYEKIKKLGLREISMDKMNCRVYPQDTMAAHILGYYNANADVAAGVEFTMKKTLESVDKEITMEMTRGGDIIYDFGTDADKITAPTVGKTVTLTIDSAIQHVCETELLKMINEKSALRGAVIVMNPNTEKFWAMRSIRITTLTNLKKQVIHK